MPAREDCASRRAVLRSIAGLGLAFGAGLGGCTPAARMPLNGEAPKLNFYNLESFIGQTTLADFQGASGIDVNMSLFSTYAEMLARMQAGNPGFDLVMASNTLAMRMHQAGMLAALDHVQLPNLANLDPQFLNPNYDPGLTFSAPYVYQALGIGYRKSKVDRPPDSWKWLFDSDRYAGRIGVIAGPSELIGCCARYLGHSVNDISDATLQQIEALLVRQRPNIKTFHEDNGQDLLLAGEIDLVLEYNNDIARVMREDSDLAFVMPREGSLLRMACLCIPATAARPGNAHKFINYALNGQAGAGIVTSIRYPTPNAAARAEMDDRYRKNPALFPPAQALAKCEFALYEGEQPLGAYAALVERVRALPAGAPVASVEPKSVRMVRDPTKEAYVPPGAAKEARGQ